MNQHRSQVPSSSSALPALRDAGTAPMVVLPLVWTAMLLLGAGDLDQAMVIGLHVSEQPLLGITLLVTRLGDWEFLLALTFLAAGWLLLKSRKLDALLLVGATISGRLLVELQKAILGRARPEQDDPFLVVESFAYPSGHSANSMLTYLLLALLLTSGEGPRRAWMAAAVLLSVAIGVSRVLLGVHWPSDVVGGWSFGLFWLILALKLVRRWS